MGSGHRDVVLAHAFSRIAPVVRQGALAFPVVRKTAVF